MNTAASSLHKALPDSHPAQSVVAVSPNSAPAANTPKPIPTLKDLFEDGIYLLFLLGSKNSPSSCAEFNQRIDQYLATFDRVCKTFDKPLDAVHDAKYAFCALLDEMVLSSRLPIRDEWERSPLQLRLFGEHLAGEGFFNRLDALREVPAKNIEVLEIFHTCLLLDFQGKYLLEGTEKLNYLIARLGQEIAALRGAHKAFAPNAKLPLKFNEYVRHELPLWLYGALTAVASVAVFFVLHGLLEAQLAGFSSIKATPIEYRQAPAQPDAPHDSTHVENKDDIASTLATKQ